jgi:hypothetical protein
MRATKQAPTHAELVVRLMSGVAPERQARALART